jgi:hypothetical protein
MFSYIIFVKQHLLDSLFLSRRGEEAQKYKAVATTKHNIFLDSFLPPGSYKKLYSYTHLLNGFAIHAESEEVFFLFRRAHKIHNTTFIAWHVTYSFKLENKRSALQNCYSPALKNSSPSYSLH